MSHDPNSTGEFPSSKRRPLGPSPLKPTFDIEEMWDTYFSLCSATKADGTPVQKGDAHWASMRKLFWAGAASMFKALGIDMPRLSDGRERPDEHCEIIMDKISRQLERYGRAVLREHAAQQGDKK